MPCSVDFLQEGASCAIGEDEVVRIVDTVLGEEDVERHCLVSVSVVSDERMAELNAMWRGQDRPTDVLSLECERPDDPDLAEGEPCELGDIVLAPDYIARQAASYGTTPANETRLLLIHGILHLLGYDHLDDDEARVMEEREDGLLALVAGPAAVTHATLTRHEGEVIP